MRSSTIKNRKCLSIAVALSAFWLCAPAATATGIFWHNNFDPALTEAKKTGKPILLSFRCVP